MSRRSTLRVERIDREPFHTLPFWNVSYFREPVWTELPFVRAQVVTLPDGLDAIVATADLQGREASLAGSGGQRLLGEALAAELESLATAGVLPPPSRVGVVLAGDFFTTAKLDRRGSSGDVRDVWRAFAARFRWVVGVAGNHDRFGVGSPPADFDDFRQEVDAHVLDGDDVRLDGLTVNGISGIIGHPGRPFRRDESAFLKLLGRMPDSDLLVLHQGPNGDHREQRGTPTIRAAIESSVPTLVVCGHCHWQGPLAELGNGAQALNVDARVVVLAPAAEHRADS